jgi:hypothetical protein
MASPGSRLQSLRSGPVRPWSSSMSNTGFRQLWDQSATPRRPRPFGGRLIVQAVVTHRRVSTNGRTESWLNQSSQDFARRSSRPQSISRPQSRLHQAIMAKRLACDARLRAYTRRAGHLARHARLTPTRVVGPVATFSSRRRGCAPGLRCSPTRRRGQRCPAPVAATADGCAVTSTDRMYVISRVLAGPRATGLSREVTALLVSTRSGKDDRRAGTFGSTFGVIAGMAFLAAVASIGGARET